MLEPGQHRTINPIRPVPAMLVLSENIDKVVQAGSAVCDGMPTKRELRT